MFIYQTFRYCGHATGFAGRDKYAAVTGICTTWLGLSSSKINKNTFSIPPPERL
jgi:hypothetical protein